MANPTARPWAIRPSANALQAPSIIGPDQSTVVLFQNPQTTTGLIGGLLQAVLTTLGVQQQQLNDANAKYIVRAINTHDRILTILRTVLTMLDPVQNRPLPKEQIRKQLYQQVLDAIAQMEKPL